MRWPLRYQFFLPFALLLIIAVMTTAATSSWLAVRRATQDRVDRSRRIVDTIVRGRLPYNDNVLLQMRGLSGGHFIAVTQADGIIGSTLDVDTLPDEWDIWKPEVLNIVQPQPVELAATQFRLTVIEPPSNEPPTRILVMIPAARWQQIQWQAAWPPLAIGGATLIVMLFVSGWLAVVQSRRIHRIQDALSGLAQGIPADLPETRPADELQDLIRSTNDLSRQLGQMQHEIRRTEQLRVLGQIASGLAHQLRNAVAGAQLAIQLHLKRFPVQDRTSLDLALNQLSIVNQQVQGLLALSKRESGEPVWMDLSELVEELLPLMRPHAEHLNIQWKETLNLPTGCQVDRNPMQAALMNLMMNALEAAGERGEVRVEAKIDGAFVVIDVVDSGPGIEPGKEREVFEPFETTKPEGVGIGLTMAKSAAVDRGGDLSYDRLEGWTRFRMTLPAECPKN